MIIKISPEIVNFFPASFRKNFLYLDKDKEFNVFNKSARDVMIEFINSRFKKIDVIQENGSKKSYNIYFQETLLKHFTLGYITPHNNQTYIKLRNDDILDKTLPVNFNGDNKLYIDVNNCDSKNFVVVEYCENIFVFDNTISLIVAKDIIMSKGYDCNYTLLYTKTDGTTIEIGTTINEKNQNLYAIFGCENTNIVKLSPGRLIFDEQERKIKDLERKLESVIEDIKKLKTAFVMQNTELKF